MTHFDVEICNAAYPNTLTKTIGWVTSVTSIFNGPHQHGPLSVPSFNAHVT